MNFVKITSRDYYNKEIFINVSSVVSLKPAMDNTTSIVTTITGEVIPCNESVDAIMTQIRSLTTVNIVEKTLPETVSQDNVQYKDLDQYPAHLPRLPTGYVDKRTSQYKEFVSNQK